MVDTIVITGAAGRIGRELRRGLAAPDRRLRLVDRVDDLGAAAETEEVVRCDLGDPAAAGDVIRGAAAVVHLAAIPVEAPFADVVEANILVTGHVFEAARRHGVSRVVFASSNHAAGFYPSDRVAEPTDPVRPDTFYGVSKVTGEALGRLYHDKYGLEVVCLRIGSFLEEPTQRRHLATWLSVRDGIALVDAALRAPDPGFCTVYGMSANTRAFWSRAGWDVLGYRPQDDAERHAERILAAAGPPDVYQDGYHGGEFTDPAGPPALAGES